jgi:hypothetical protein
MSGRKLAVAVAALCVAAPVAGAPAAKQGAYATVVSGAYLGGGVFSGKLGTPAQPKKLNGISVRRRCADRRRIDTGTHDGSVQITIRSSRRGRWQFTLPEEPGRTIKIFVLAKQLPRGEYCTAATLKIQQPK